MARGYRDMAERIFANTIVEGDCWIWTGRLDRYGYGNINVRVYGVHMNLKAHRVAFEHFIGPIPAGKELDHVCCNTACVHPNHLRPVTKTENVQLMHKRRKAA